MIAALVACSPDPELRDPHVDGEQGLSVAIGSGDERFAPLQDGDPLLVLQNPTGDWGVQVAIRVAGSGPYAQWSLVGLAPDAVRLLSWPEINVELADYDPRLGGWSSWSGAWLHDPYWLGVYCDAGFGPACDAAAAGDPRVFGCALDGLPLELSATATDLSDGLEGAAAVEIALTLDPVARADCP